LHLYLIQRQTLIYKVIGSTPAGLNRQFTGFTQENGIKREKPFDDKKPEILAYQPGKDR